MSKNLSDIFPPTEIGGGGGGIGEAPLTGKMYARQSGSWSEFATGNLDDGNKDGEILTWDTATANWTHDDTLIVKGSNVGIRTDSPAGPLQVRVGTDLNVAINTVDYAGAKKARISAYDDAVNASVPLAIEGEYLRLRTGGSDSLSIDATGNATFSGGQVVVGGINNGTAVSNIGVLKLGCSTDNANRRSWAIRSESVSPGNLGIWASTTNSADPIDGNEVVSISATGTATFSGTIEAKASGTHKMLIWSGANYTSIQQDGDVFGIQPQGGTVGMTLNATGTATFSGSVYSHNFYINAGAGTLGVPGGSRFEVFEPSIGNDRRLVFHTADIGDPFYIDATGAATFSGNASVVQISGSNSAGPSLRAEPSTGTSIIYADCGGGVTQAALKIQGRNSGGTVDFLSFGKITGDATFSGTVNATGHQGTDFYRGGRSGIRFGTGYLAPMGASNAPEDAAVDIGSATNNHRWKDAHFSGTVNATTINGRVTDVADHIKNITPTQIANWDAGTGGGGGATTDGRISDNDIIHWNEAWDWGDHSQAGYQPAGSYALTGHTHNEYLLKNGNWSCNGSITATGTITGTDCIATSDERLKRDITTAPVGLIDDLKGREWSWRDSGAHGSGVVAQELEKVLPHLVHEDDEGMKAVSYNGLVAYLIEEVKALKAEVRELKGA